MGTGEAMVKRLAETQVPTFNVKQVAVPLFGEVETSTAKWLAAFAAGTTTPVKVDSSALDFIAEELELDAEGLASDADRYVNGKYRAKARGLGGARLGDLGEIFTFLVNRAVPGREVVRVVSWRAGAGQTVKGTRFPQPDFILLDPGVQAAALEVKSTEAFDFIDLRDTPRNWRWLQPCSSVGPCREQALPQLAYLDGSLTPQQHALQVRDGKVVPFPVGKGVAAVFLAVDGRVNGLRKNETLRTPKSCREQKRDCWLCLPAECHFALVTMPNAPGALSLGGGDRDGSAAWLRSYRRWSQALASRDLLAVRSTIAVLADSTNAWLDSPGAREPQVLRAFWGSYLRDAMRTRGFDVEVPVQFDDLGVAEAGIDSTPAPLAEAANREANLAEIARVLGDAQDGRDPVASFVMSADVRRDGRTRETLSVGVAGDFVEFRLASSSWWAGETVGNTEAASRIAGRLFALSLDVTRQPRPPLGELVPLREVVAQVGEQVVPLGWDITPAGLGDDAWRGWFRDWPFLLDGHPGHWPPWPALLALGDQRLRLRVLRDGRAELRIQKSLWRRSV